MKIFNAIKRLGKNKILPPKPELRTFHSLKVVGFKGMDQNYQEDEILLLEDREYNKCIPIRYWGDDTYYVIVDTSQVLAVMYNKPKMQETLP